MEYKVMDQPLISVVMATYNGERYIAEAIQSVLDQTFIHFEFLIVDDGSTDATASIIASFDDPRIIYLKKDANTGIADSLNLGISKARGQYIARMDDDDVCMPNRFEKQLKVFHTHKHLIVCGTSVLLNDGNIKLYPEHDEDIQMALLFGNTIIHPTVMMRKAILLEEPYDANMVPSEDYDLWSRLINRGEFYCLQSPLLYYRQHGKSETSVRRREQLALNVIIAKRLFDTKGFHHVNKHDCCLRIFVSKDYSITGRDLRSLQNWFKQLKYLNLQQHIFSVLKFNQVADQNLDNFLISYFTNQKFLKKILPFFYLNFRTKINIVKYYIKKLILLVVY